MARMESESDCYERLEHAHPAVPRHILEAVVIVKRALRRIRENPPNDPYDVRKAEWQE